MKDIELVFRIFLPLYIIAVLVLFADKVSSFRRKYKINPLVVTKKDRLMYIFQLYRDIMFVFVTLTILIYSFLPKYYHLLIPVSYLEYLCLRFTGMFILTFSIVIIRVSQNQLRGSWRVGIDDSEVKTELITSGLYRWSRNPIALGMILMTFGFFLVIPNIITFTIINLTWLIFQLRIRIEEEHMYKRYGKDYEEYRRKTRRWI